jgi:diguanylate cyclase (GGDEF)-like protein
MGLRTRIIVYVVVTVFLTLAVGGILDGERASQRLQADTVDDGLAVMRALAAPASVPLATRRIEDLDRVLARFAEDNSWGRLELLDVGIVDADGRVVAHTDPRRFGRLQRDAFTIAAMSEEGPSQKIMQSRAGRRLRLAVPIVSGLRWGTATATLSLERVDALSAANRRQNILTSAASAGFIGLLVYLLLSVLVLRPMKDLTGAVLRLADGDLHARAVDRSRTREFGLLTDVFNAMAGQIAASTRRLENQVYERTRALEAANAELERLAATDGLTGLANHRTLHGQLDVEVARARREERPLSMLMIDVDHFKAFNDAHGHPEGDAVLVAIADVLRERLRSTDLPARYGGEEFAVLLPGTDDGDAKRVAAKLVAAVRDRGFPGEESQPSGRVTISVGLASWNGPDEDAADFLARADSAMYDAKAGGRDRVVAQEGAA